jgi:hypothetical protein
MHAHVHLRIDQAHGHPSEQYESQLARALHPFLRVPTGDESAL